MFFSYDSVKVVEIKQEEQHKKIIKISISFEDIFYYIHNNQQ